MAEDMLEYRVPRAEVQDFNLAGRNAQNLMALFNPILMDRGFRIFEPINRYFDTDTGELIFTQKKAP